MKTITDWIALANAQQQEINGLRRRVAELEFELARLRAGKERGK